MSGYMKGNEMATLDYYRDHADSFITGTADVDFHETQDRFLSYLQPGALILDFGCGSGRDTKYFLDHGFEVEATDGSPEMVTHASKLTGITVKQMLFQELKEQERYDGIWACASILHLPKEDLKKVLQSMKQALKPNGVIYCSFKYGDHEGERNGRWFTDFTSESFREFWTESGMAPLEIVEEWMTGDVRPGRENEKWLNIIVH